MRQITSYLCCGSLSQLTDNRSVATVKCPLCGSVHSKSEYSGKVCQTCDLSMLGVEALGLNVMLEGVAGKGLEDPLGVL